MLSRVVWYWVFRVVVFWAIVIGTVFAISLAWPPFDPALIWNIVLASISGRFEGLSRPEFAYALASGLGAIALGLAVAFLLMHALAIPLSLRLAQRSLDRPDGMVAFAGDYESIRQALERHPLIGHAWQKFDETLVRPRDDGPINSTVRPQTFVNIGVAREKLFGLKMMGSIPGYFVGVGLLLTFIGLVFALHNASAAVSATDAGGMQKATRELLHVATFKFATSIAGLAASIVLSLLFRSYLIAIEGAFDRFCRAAERNLRYTAPQSITAQMNERLAEQLTELKQINSADFFSRMGEQISPRIQSAFSDAVAPMNEHLAAAMDRLSQTSQSGVSELLTQFSTSVQGSAGTELRELAETLKAMQATLMDAQRNIHGTGEDFSRRMSDAAENLNRLVSEAGSRLDDSSEKSRAALSDIVVALRETFDQTNRNVEAAVMRATGTASAQVEEILGTVFSRFEGQVGAFQSGLAAFQTGLDGHLAETSRTVTASQSAAVEAIGTASAEAAKALRDGLADGLQRISDEVGRFTAAMRDTAATMVAQSGALKETTSQSRVAADAFSRTAQDVRTAAAPLVQSGEKIAGATDRLAASVKASVAALEAGQASGQQLAAALQAHFERVSDTWRRYAEHFDKVDRDLAQAFEKMHDAAEQQGRTLADYAVKVDQGFANAVQKLNPLLSGLGEGVQDLGDTVEKLKRALATRTSK